MLRQLNNYFNNNPDRKVAIEKLIGLLSVNNLKLLNYMNELTNQLEQDAKKETLYFKRAADCDCDFTVICACNGSPFPPGKILQQPDGEEYRPCG